MNKIKFIKKGFILHYPDREETWKRGFDTNHIRYRDETYKLQGLDDNENEILG